MKEKYISRVDSSKSKMYGYLVRLYRGKGVLFQQWLSDKEYGGPEKGLEEAIKIRDLKMKEFNYQGNKGQENREWKPVQHQLEPTSNTGHLGIYESKEYKVLKDGTKRECRYIAASFVVDKGKPKTKKFYIGQKRSREEAIDLAIKFRQQKELSARAAAVEYNRELQKRLIEAENKMQQTRKKRPAARSKKKV